MFEESTRVPLIIYHPKSQQKNVHYTKPVELIDIFPTVVDLFNIPKERECLPKHGQSQCKPIQGKSLAPVVVGENWQFMQSYKKAKKGEAMYRSWNSPTLDPFDSKNSLNLMNQDFAISQSWRCIRKNKLLNEPESPLERNFRNNWFECNVDTKDHENEVSVMGYALRTSHFRYNIWLHWDRINNMPQLDVPPFAEELYDHRDTTTANFTHVELANLALRPQYDEIVQRYRQSLIHWLRSIPYHGPRTKDD